MTTLTERDLQLTLPAGAIGRKFDDAATHGLTHCMKAVDFIVELADRILFIEFKDPDHPKARRLSRERFMQTFSSGKLDEELKAKYRDSFLYEWGSGRANKPIYYLVLIAADSLSDAELVTRTDALRRQLPVDGPSHQPWKRPLVAGCAVMNMQTWNSKLREYAVSRLSS